MFNFKLKVKNEHKLHTKVKNEHKFSIKSLEATVYDWLTLHTKYSSKTNIDRVLALVRTFLKSISYRANSSSLANRILSKILPSSLRYSSSTSKRERFLIKNLLNKISFRSIHSLKEHFFSRAIPKNTTYKLDSGKAIENMCLKATSSTLYRSTTSLTNKIMARMRSVMSVSSKVALSPFFHVREFIKNAYKSKSLLSEKIFLRMNVFNKSLTNSNVSKEALNVRMLTKPMSDLYRFTSDKVNRLTMKTSISQKGISDVNTDEQKVFQYYVHSLNEYKDMKLNQLPEDLLRVCYVVEKDWSFVNKMFKTWAGLKDRVTSWSDLK